MPRPLRTANNISIKIEILYVAHEQELLPLLPEKAKEVYEKMKDNLTELGQVCECEIFTQGFKLGARIMLDVLDDSDIEA